MGGASQWRLQFNFPRLDWATAEVVAGWINSLQGQVGTFYYHPYIEHSVTTNALSLSGAGNQWNTSVNVAGFPANTKSNVTNGSYFTIGEQLLQVTSAANVADSNGIVKVNFVPSLRLTYASGSSVIFNQPFGKFRLSSSDGAGFTLDYDRLPTFPTINATEAV